MSFRTRSLRFAPLSDPEVSVDSDPGDMTTFWIPAKNMPDDVRDVFLFIVLFFRCLYPLAGCFKIKCTLSTLNFKYFTFLGIIRRFHLIV
jgi:hypothetical protein